MYKLNLVCLMLLVGAAVINGQLNDFTESLNFRCDPNTAPYAVQSRFSSTFRDRRWDFRCSGRLPGNWNQCFETRFSPVEAPSVGLLCDGGILNGVRSTFDPTTQDRSWSFRCCNSAEFVTTDCTSTSSTGFTQTFWFWYSSPRIFNGMVGVFSPFDRDRSWSFGVCRVVRRQ